VEPDDTLIEAEPDLLPRVAVIVAFPMLTAATTPLDETLATVGLELPQLTLPVRTFPLASLSTAVACDVWPTGTRAIPTVTVTVATLEVDAATDRLADPCLLPLVAVMVAEPAPTPVTNPLDDTVAMLEFELLHVTEPPEITAPEASLRTAVA
jgi:hypothetical protein